MKEPIQIKTCNIEITKRCNLSCNHCITDSSMASPEKLSTKEILHFIKFLKKKNCKSVVITGGEPLIRKDIFEILKFIKSNEMEIFLHTNCSLINPDNIDELTDLVSCFVVSLDGANKETNDTIRCAGAFKTTLKKIKLLKKKKAKISLGVTECSKNYREIPEIIRLGKEWGIDSFQITKLVYAGRAKKNEEFFNKEFKSLTREMEGTQSNNCNASLRTPFIRFDGEIFPCSEIAFRSEKGYIGNIKGPLKINSDTEKGILNQAKKLKCCYKVKRTDIPEPVSTIARENFKCPFKIK